MARPTDSGGGYHPAMEASTRGRIRIEAFEVARFSHPAGSPLAGRTGIVMAYHAGQNVAFPGRPIHVQAAEREAARAPDHTIDAWVDFPGARYVEEDGEAELLPGVRLIPAPGHTPGHQSLAVDAVDGRTLLVGQALYTRAEWDGASEPGVSGLASAWDPAVYRASVARLRALEPDVVLFGHDR